VEELVRMIESGRKGKPQAEAKIISLQPELIVRASSVSLGH